MIKVTYNYSEDEEFLTEVFMADDFEIVENLNMIRITETNRIVYIMIDFLLKIEVM